MLYLGPTESLAQLAYWCLLHWSTCFSDPSVTWSKIINIELWLSVSVTRFGDFWTLGNFWKPLATTILTKSPTFLGKFCKGVKIIFGQLLQTFGDFLQFTLLYVHKTYIYNIWQCIVKRRNKTKRDSYL